MDANTIFELIDNEDEDLISVSSYNSDDENNDIDWYIDRTGNFNLLNQNNSNQFKLNCII